MAIDSNNDYRPGASTRAAPATDFGVQEVGVADIRADALRARGGFGAAAIGDAAARWQDAASRELLEHLAAYIYPLCRLHGLRVRRLEELREEDVVATRASGQLQEGHCLLGVHHGPIGADAALVRVRLKPQLHAVGNYLRDGDLLETLLHELAHTRAKDHGDVFQAFLLELRHDMDKLRAVGVNGQLPVFARGVWRPSGEVIDVFGATRTSSGGEVLGRGGGGGGGGGFSPPLVPPAIALALPPPSPPPPLRQRLQRGVGPAVDMRKLHQEREGRRSSHRRLLLLRLLALACAVALLALLWFFTRK